MEAFVTVGSTKFDALVQAALSAGTIKALHDKGYRKLVIQAGDSSHQYDTLTQHEMVHRTNLWGMDIELWKFKQTLQVEYERADIIISHAGSGTIIDVLRLGKPLIVVPNHSLLDNHQEELADALSDLGHLKSCKPFQLPETITNFDLKSIVPFPPFDGGKFRALLDKEMGFIV